MVMVVTDSVDEESKVEKKKKDDVSDDMVVKSGKEVENESVASVAVGFEDNVVPWDVLSCRGTTLALTAVAQKREAMITNMMMREV